MNKKKILSVIMAFVLLAVSPVMSAFAAGSTNITADRTTTITATVRTYVSASGEVEADDDAAVMSITIGWDNVDFVYDSITKWNPDILDYEQISGGWRNDGIANITVVNSSNCEIDAEVEFEKTNTDNIYRNVDGTFDKYSARIDSGVDKLTAPSENFVLTVSGRPDTDVSTTTSNFGIITVKITGSNSPSGSVTGGSMDGQDNDG